MFNRSHIETYVKYMVYNENSNRGLQRRNTLNRSDIERNMFNIIYIEKTLNIGPIEKERLIDVIDRNTLNRSYIEEYS